MSQKESERTEPLPPRSEDVKRFVRNAAPWFLTTFTTFVGIGFYQQRFWGSTVVAAVLALTCLPWLSSGRERLLGALGISRSVKRVHYGTVAMLAASLVIVSEVEQHYRIEAFEAHRQRILAQGQSALDRGEYDTVHDLATRYVSARSDRLKALAARADERQAEAERRAEEAAEDPYAEVTFEPKERD